MVKYPIYQPEITALERKYVMECLDSTWISSKGKFVDQFEAAIADQCQVKHAISVFNGTVALHLALLPLGLKPGDEVIVSDFSYIATSNAVHYVGATPIYVDADPDTWNISIEAVEQAIGPNTKAIIYTDVYGMPMYNYDELKTLAEKHNLYLIEDAAESLGAKSKGRAAGSMGDIATFSFFGNKTITTGEGGMALTDNDDWAKQIRQLKNQGNSPTIRYVHEVLGYNYRMTNIQAAIGCAQLERLDDILQKKRSIHQYYRAKLSDLVVFQVEDEAVSSSFWMNGFLLKNESQKHKLERELKDEGIETRPFFPPMSSMPFNQTADSPVSRSLSLKGLILPSYHTLQTSDLDFIIDQVRRSIKI